MTFLPIERPDGTLVWLPDGMASRMAVKAGDRLTAKQWQDNELQSLIASREAANEAGAHCTAEWHKKNGYL